MILPIESKFLRKFWDIYFYFQTKYNFRALKLHSNYRSSPEKSILLFCNHVSWWDGIWIYTQSKIFFRKNFYVMMLENTLMENKALRSAGAFSIQPGARTMIHSFDFARKLLKNPSNLLLFFPQGKLESIYEDKILFQKGVKLLLDSEQSMEIVFGVQLVEYGNQKKPTVRQYFKGYDGTKNFDALQESYQMYYNECLSMQKTNFCIG